MHRASRRSRWSVTALLGAHSSTSSAIASEKPPRFGSAAQTSAVLAPTPAVRRTLPSRRRPAQRVRDAHMRNERELHLAGFARVAGIDEVGRGCLAGPVVAAAVILPERHRIKGLRDSKVLPRARREALYELILDRAEAVGVGCVEVDTIDRINILQATKVAM